MMRDKDRSAVSAACGLGKECVTRFTRRSFDRHLLFPGERADVCSTQFKCDAPNPWRASASFAYPCPRQAGRLRDSLVVIALNQPFHKLCVSIARSTAQM